MIVNDIWGEIMIDSKYEKVINTKEFNDLKNKNQLGINTNVNAVHNRYQHSLGTYLLSTKLINICKNKFENIIDIKEEDEEVVKLTALIHDIGHGPYSHVAESLFNQNHEEKTIEILLDPNTEIHKVIVEEFGINILKKVVNVLENKEKIKRNIEVNSDISLAYNIEKLLCGGIDIDRIDYIYRDSKHAFNETNDFSNILESINLEYIDEALEIVFDENAEYSISNFFNKRFELYDKLYLNNKTRILENVFKKFLEKTNNKITWNMSETEINNFIINNMNSNDEVIKRYATMLKNRYVDDEVIIKEINDNDEYSNFKNRLFNNTPLLLKYSDILYESFCKVKIYNKDNKTFINKNGIIKDICECSKILNSNLYKEKYIVGIDLYLLKKLLIKDNKTEIEISKIIKEVKKLFSPEIEEEKKYLIKEGIISAEAFKIIRDSLNLSNPSYIINDDTYYDDEEDYLKQNGITFRKRVVNGEEEWFLKRGLEGITSVSKRQEKTFKTMSEALYFLETEWNIKVKNLIEKVSLKTSRVKYDLNFKNGLFEVAFDKTVPIVENDEYSPNYMIECELKKGSSNGLYFINEIMKQFDFIEPCNYSKKEYALNKIKHKKLVKSIL